MPASHFSTFDQTILTGPLSAVESYMDAFVDERPLPANLRDAVKYVLLGGGKRLRPVLTVRCAEACGGSMQQALSPAAAIEMVHAFSLVHDDLPAMDDDDLRRGRPTLHKATNEAMAILAGDVLLGLAVEMVLTRLEPPSLAAQIARELIEANNNMIAGQVYDTLPDFPADLPDIEKLRIIHRNKTGALIRCACRMGAIVGGGDDQQIHALTRFGEIIGLMFQVVDDVLDVTQTTEHLGKTAAKDIEQGKMTYPALVGIEESQRIIQTLHHDALAALSDLGQPAEPLRQLTQYLAHRTR